MVVAFGGRTPVTDFGPFWQLPMFRYLTGYLYADATLVMTVRGGHVTSATLFANRSTPRRLLYYGPEPDSAGIAELSGGLASRNAADLVGALDSLANGGATFWYARDFEDADFQSADSLTRGGRTMAALQARHPGLMSRDAQGAIMALRARKSPAELALIRRAADISADGHRAVMRTACPGMFEYQLAATLEHAFKNGGGERPAYGSIVGSGPNATLLHYMRDAQAVAGDVVVMDAAPSSTATRPTSPGRCRSTAFHPRTAPDLPAGPRRAGGRRAQLAGGDVVAGGEGLEPRRPYAGSRAARADRIARCAARPPRPAAAGRTRATRPGAVAGDSRASLTASASRCTTRRSTTRAPHVPGGRRVHDRARHLHQAQVLDLLPDTPRNRAFMARVRPRCTATRTSGCGSRTTT